MLKKRILIIHTGGTIAMVSAEDGSVKQTEEHPLSALRKELDQLVHHQEIQLYNLPSAHITPQHMFQLAQRINREFEEGGWDGIVVTHGTDTLEETAYLLDLLHHRPEPVILTGAMRASGLWGADGPLNLIHAVRVATCPTAREKGVLVVLNEEIHAAQHVTKMNAHQIHSFQSPTIGPIGLISNSEVIFYSAPLRRTPYSIGKLTKKVALLKAVTGMEASWVTPLIPAVDGVVIEALGQGNLPLSLLPAVNEMVAQQTPVVITSRSIQGLVDGVYDYPGGGRQLLQKGVIFAKGLSGPKARLKLMIALEISTDLNQLQEMFQP